ncbi:uncharacterized protein Pyn_22124 [Prunus yedoensis var. nudiflora]|uniref:Uncharacterized protein n=1 Tax=Prunus yedoensis var. nudiflora TaxID=2094558 RepID=A0A314XRC2_PRUYE|nr:uncharacterized protein Pyn_22124 [Prunus yedoensis var. nudiflora]
MGNEMGNYNTSGLRDEENLAVEVGEKSLVGTANGNDIKEENEIVPAAEGKYFHEKTSNRTEVTPETNEAGEGDSKMELATSLNDSGHDNPIEKKMEETDLQGTIKQQLEKQASFKKEEEGAISTSHDPEPTESIHLELNQHELATIHPDDQSVDDSGSLQGNEDCLGSSLISAFEVKGHLSDTEALKNMDESVDSNTDPVMEKERDDLLLEQKASQEQLESSEERLKLKMEIKSEPEVIPVTNSPNSHLEVPEPEDKCIILKEEIRLIEKSQKMENTTMMITQSKLWRVSDRIRILQVNDKDCQTEETKVAENGHLVVMCVNNQNEASEDYFLDSDAKVEVVPELGTVPPELTIPHCNHKEEESTEKRAVQQNGDNTEPLYAIEIGGTETTEQFLSLQLPVDQAKVLPPKSVCGYETVQSTNDSILNLKQESRSEFLATEASTGDCTTWIAEALASMNKLALDIPGQHVTQHTETLQAAAETKISANHSSEPCAKVEASETASCGSETQESMGRYSTESDADNLNVRGRIQKSPSFSLDLKNEARTEESDCTPLLYHDKAAMEGSPCYGDDVSLGNLIKHTSYEPDLPQYQAMPVEEKIITLERGDSDKSKTPFIGFLKEEEEARIVVTPHIHDKHSATQNSTKNLLASHAKEATPTTSSKGKEKRRHRSSLFTNCMCCATVIN